MAKAHFKVTAQGAVLDFDEITVLPGGLTVGRDKSNGLPLPHPLISRHHAQLSWRDNNTLIVEDLGSSNGSWVNNERLPAHEQRPLQVGDVVRFGPFSLALDQIETHSTDNEPATDNLPGPTNVPTALPPAPQPDQPGAAAAPPAPAVPPAVAPLDGPHLGRRAGRRPHTDEPPADQGAILPPPRDPWLEIDGTMPPVLHGDHNGLVPGIPKPPNSSNWMQYLPAIYSDDEFMGRYMLAFESVLSPVMWILDHFPMFLSADTAPEEWLIWMASWFDVLLVPELDIKLKREIMRQIGWLFMRRGTRAGLERLLELYFEVKAEIIDNERPAHVTVRLPLSQRPKDSKMGREVANLIIQRWIPAHATYSLEVT